MLSWLNKQSAAKLVLSAGVLALASLTAISWLAQPDNRAAVRQAIDGPHSLAADPTPAVAEQGGTSEAEKIARLQRALASNRKQLADLKKQLEDPNSDYNRADTQFRALDELLAAKMKELQQLRAAGKSDASLEQTVNDLRKQRQEARDRFDLEIDARKARQQKFAVLERLVREDQEALDQLTGAAREVTLLSGLVKLSCRCSPNDKGTCAACADSGRAPAAAAPPPPPTGGTEASSAPAEDGSKKKDDRRLLQAREQARLKDAAARKASARAQSLDQRIAALRQNIDVERRLLETAHKKLDLTRQTHAELAKELERRSEAHAPEAELVEGRRQLGSAAQSITEAQKDVEDSTGRLAELRAELAGLQVEQLAAQREADTKKREAEAADKRVATLENPFTLHNLLKWFLAHGPRMLVILGGMFLTHRIVLLMTRRVVHWMTHTQRHHGRLDEEDRAETLVGVFRNSASLLILGGGTLMLLDEVGIPIVPLMGGAAVFGLAVAFGAQNLIKDYFCGFMVLLEDQYAVNDVVRIGDVEGRVERISLRITVLRDVTGVAHFIPHGTISTVSNMTHGFSRAFFEIGVAYKEDADAVMQVLMDLAAEMRQDEEFGPLIVEDPEMLGVDSFDDSSVMIKFYMDTRPMKQGRVKREMLRRIKRRFDQLGIEIPFPHRTVYHRYEEGQAAPPRPTAEDGPGRRAA